MLPPIQRASIEAAAQQQHPTTHPRTMQANKLRAAARPAPQRFQCFARPRSSRHVCSAVQVQADAVAELLCWAKSKNVALEKVSLANSIDNKPILVAAKDLSAGEAVFSVPQSAWVTPEAAQQTAAGRLLADLEPWLQVALLLLLEKAGQRSSFAPYVDSLPSSLDTPLFWSEGELALLQGTQLLQNLQAYKQFFKQTFQQLEAELFAPNRQLFPEAVFTLSNFTWAAATVRSRIHGPLDGSSSGGQLALVPVADLAPHRTSANSSWKVKSGGLFGSGGLQLVVEASRAVRKGEELTLNYGADKLDNSLLLDYGVLDSNEPKPGYSLALAIPEEDKWYDDKADVLERNGMAASTTFSLQPGELPTEEMLGFLRLMQLSGSDVFLLEAIFEAQVWEFMCQPVSRPNEQSMCTAMISGAQEALEGYPTSIDEDIALLRGGSLAAGSREALAVKVRLGEKEALDRTMAFFEGRQGELLDLEYYQERRLRRLGLIDDEGRTTYDSFFKDGIA